MYIKKVFAFILILSFIFLFSCSDSNPDNLIINTNQSDRSIQSTEEPKKINDLNVVYKTVNDKDLLMDIYYPTNIKYEKSPLIVGFYGGGWVAGDKTQLMYIFAPIIKELLLNGYTVALPQYRYAEQSSYFPAQIEDCIDAIEYLKDNADEYNIDINSIGVIGYSAGAQLAMLAAYSPDEMFISDSSLDIKYCLSFAGPSKMYGNELNDFTDNTKFLIENLFNGTYAEKENDYMLGSPYIYIDNHADRPDMKKTPLFLAHDEYDDVVPFKQSQIMYDKAVEAGIPCELLKLNGFYHQIDLSTDYYNTTPSINEIVKKVLDFIYKYS